MKKQLSEMLNRRVKFDKDAKATLTDVALEELVMEAFILGATTNDDEISVAEIKRVRELAGIPHKGNHV